MLRWHRLLAVCSVVLLAYVVFTGAGIELADMRALVTHAPETDPDMLMMRQHIYGPPNYAVVSAPDYTARALPTGLDVSAGLVRAAALGRAAVPKADLRLVELRMAGAAPAAHVQMGERQLIFDLASGAALPAADLPPPQPGRDFWSLRSWFKYYHRFNYIGGPATVLNLMAGLVFCVMIVTGLVHYTRLLTARGQLGRGGVFWRGRGVWRDLHRWVSVVAGVLVIWLTLSGIALSIDNVGAFVRERMHPQQQGPNAFDGDQSAPLPDAALAPMARVTLGAFHTAMPAAGIRVIRLRIFAGYRQGVVVADDAGATQLVFNTASGAPMGMSEKGYPDIHFPFGWTWHQRLKQIHRGDIFGMTGRWLDTIGALALVYLVVSGTVMYAQLWSRRRRAGHAALVW